MHMVEIRYKDKPFMALSFAPKTAKQLYNVNAIMAELLEICEKYNCRIFGVDTLKPKSQTAIRAP